MNAVPAAMVRRRFLVLGLAVVLLASWGGRVRADVDMIDMWSNGNASPGTVFPNWKYLLAGSWDVLLCNGCAGPTEELTGVTVVNFGSATNADISAVYMNVKCSAGSSVLYTLTYAGVYNEESGSYPAWTWSGTTINLASCGDYCGGTCGGYFTVNLYADISPCPTELRTVRLGLPYHSYGGTALWWGSLSDNNGYVLPWGDLLGEQQTIFVTLKTGPDYAAPGDTVAYTITYGRPGTAALANVIVTDTLPPFSHYLPGSGVPAPDAGEDPNWGPPVRLLWTLPGGAVTGGPTGEVVFKTTVDWGNGEGFEPGSGDAAPPEGTRLTNEAHVNFIGSTCPQDFDLTGPVGTVVRRFLFWKVGDNDMLFSGSYGQPPDDMTYSLYLKNTSATKVWWNVDVWDTVPAELDPWCAGCGFEDPCLGWTMTPGGCAAATPGWTVGAGATLLTWRLDMPPGLTLTLRWHAQVRPTATAGGTALNTASVLERGRTSIIGGTGSSSTPKVFTHQAPILLPTTYTSYLGFGTVDNFSWSCPCPDGVAPLDSTTYYIVFYPLNKKADFSLYQQLHSNDLFTQQGGLSPPINAFVGGCLTTNTDWLPGCKIERAPAVYKPNAYTTCASFTQPTRNLYKLVANSPLIWELLTAALDDPNDQGTYSGTTSLTYLGYASYSFARVCSLAADARDGFYLVNTSATADTTFHLFLWDATNLAWDYRQSRDVTAGSQTYFPLDTMGHWKILSSAAPMIVYKAYPALADANGNNNHGVQVPNTQNGYLVPSATTADFYAYAGGPVTGDNASLIVGNFGGTTASYRIWEYAPANQTLPVGANPDHLVPTLVDSTGTWRLVTQDTVPAGIAAPANAHIYGRGYSSGLTDTYALYRVSLLGGGPVQVYGGRDIDSAFSSGHVLHATDAQPSGAVYWWHQSYTDSFNGSNTCPAPYSSVLGLDFYCPKLGTKVQLVSGDGYSAAYTTNGPDECVYFQRLTIPAAGTTRNYKATATGGIIISAFKVTCQMKQKLYTAPFLGQGVHYQIIAPPVAYVGQSFWITIVVVDVGNTTKTDYCGVTSFTGTDATATMGGTGMNAFDYTWQSNQGVCPGCSGACDNGVRIFVNVVLNQLGLQTVVAADTADGSVNGLTTIMVVGLDLKLTKQAPLTVAASGDTVAFKVCWSNYSSASAFTFVITDALPEGTTFLPEAGTAALDCGNTRGVLPQVAYSISTSPTPPAAFTTGNPIAGARWLRWTLPQIGVSTTGCACYRVTVN